MNVIDTSKAEQYAWGKGCSGWHLLQSNDFSIIEESVPPGQAEECHFHHVARQFFYILQGEAVMVVKGCEFILRSQQGMEIPPGVAHQFRNDSQAEVRFLVISVPRAQGDRVTVA
jgi:mannose-6-phosphate isomerase-like protein (cupin superfamily)